MNINQRINQNFVGAVLVCQNLAKQVNKPTAKQLFEGLKNPQYCKTSWITASKKMKKQNHIIGVGKYLKSEPFIN